MSEIALQNKLKLVLESEQEWKGIQIVNSTSEFTTVGDLVRLAKFDLRIEKSLTDRTHKQLSKDIFYGQKPDIGLVSESSGQLRILIEVKQATGSTHKERDASQFVRHLLYLLATTDQKPHGRADIDRAVLVAAPDAWFKNEKMSGHWSHLVSRYGDLAKTFKITLGEIRTDQLD